MFGQRVFRIEPAMPVQAYKTYQIFAPLATHWRPATCEEAGCPHYTHGWASVIDEATEQGQAQAHYIRRDSGRGFTEARDEAGLTVFTFGPGQRCFNSGSHRVQVGRPSLFLTRPGDWRGNPEGRGAVYRHTRPELWFEDFATHQDRLAQQIQKG